MASSAWWRASSLNASTGPPLSYAEEEETARGSARSIPEFDISRALDQVDGLLVRHGGHPLAAGFTVKTANLPALRAALMDLAAAELGDRSQLRPTLAIDAEIGLEDLSWSVIEQFGRLEPTGEDNGPPVLLARHTLCAACAPWATASISSLALTAARALTSSMPSASASANGKAPSTKKATLTLFSRPKSTYGRGNVACS